MPRRQPLRPQHELRVYSALERTLHEEWAVLTGRTTWQAIRDADRAKRFGPTKTSPQQYHLARIAAKNAAKPAVRFDYPG